MLRDQEKKSVKLAAVEINPRSTDGIGEGEHQRRGSGWICLVRKSRLKQQEQERTTVAAEGSAKEIAILTEKKTKTHPTHQKPPSADPPNVPKPHQKEKDQRIVSVLQTVIDTMSVL